MDFAITFAPVLADYSRMLAKMGDVITVDGVAYDFGGMADGDVLPATAVSGGWLADDVRRQGDTLHLVISLPHGANAPSATLFPDTLIVVDDGPVLVPYWGAVGTPVFVPPEPVIDWTQMPTTIEASSALADARADALRNECRRRIFAVADRVAQINLAAAAAADALTAPDLATYRAGLGWVHAMRAASRDMGEDVDYRTDRAWPSLPDGVADLADRF